MITRIFPTHIDHKIYFTKIKLKNFRNYDFEKIKLSENTNIIFGDNAQGKTNILEAIFISSLGKSFRTNKEKELIKENEDKAIIEIKFLKNIYHDILT